MLLKQKLKHNNLDLALQVPATLECCMQIMDQIEGVNGEMLPWEGERLSEAVRSSIDCTFSLLFLLRLSTIAAVIGCVGPRLTLNLGTYGPENAPTRPENSETQNQESSRRDFMCT